MNPLSRMVAAVVVVLAVLAAVFFGLIVLALLLGGSLLFWLGVRLRLWWLQRHMPSPGTAPARPARKGEVIEAEYTIVSRDED